MCVCVCVLCISLSLSLRACVWREAAGVGKFMGAVKVLRVSRYGPLCLLFDEVSMQLGVPTRTLLNQSYTGPMLGYRRQ